MKRVAVCAIALACHATPAAPMLCKPTEDPSRYHAECRAGRCEAVKK